MTGYYIVIKNIALIGAAGFIGTNLAIELSKHYKCKIRLIDAKDEYFDTIRMLGLENVEYILSGFTEDSDFAGLVAGQDMVIHLASTSMPADSNRNIPLELQANIVTTSFLLEACAKEKIKRVIFLSSGGQVYGKCDTFPIKESQRNYPITSYGIQKMTIEKLLHLYEYLYGLDYRVLRVANPYGPYQRPNGKLGVITTLIHRAIAGRELVIFGDGSVVRDFIYIDDVVKGICNVSFKDCSHKIYNIGGGIGNTVNEVAEVIEKVLNSKLRIRYIDERKNEIPVNYLDISRYEAEFGKLINYSLEEGIRRTISYFKSREECHEKG